VPFIIGSYPFSAHVFEFADNSKPLPNLPFFLAGFQSCRRCAARSSKENCSSETNLVVFEKIGEIGPGRLFKALGAAPRNLLSDRNKGCELVSFQKLGPN
jgi:hypothetical protein